MSSTKNATIMSGSQGMAVAENRSSVGVVTIAAADSLGRAGADLVAGGGPTPKSDVQILGNTIDGFQFGITLDRQRGGRYRDVVIRGNTSTRSPLVARRGSGDEGIVVESNTGPGRDGG